MQKNGIKNRIKVKTIRETVDIYRVSDFKNKLFKTEKYIKLNGKIKYKKYIPHVGICKYYV